MSYVSLISLTQATYDGLKAAGTLLDRPIAFFITDAAVGQPNIIFGRAGQTATTAQAAGAVVAGGAASVKDNFAGTAAPIVTNDVAQGYAVGSRWVDVTGSESYICLSAAAGAAVWSKTTVGTIAEVTGLQAALDLKMAQYQQGHPFHTAATQAGHTVTGTSQFSAGLAPWMALQAAPSGSSEWATAGAGAASLTYELPQPTIFNRVVLMGRANAVEYPTNWSIEGSADGTTYTTLVANHTESLQTEVTRDFTNTAAYKFYRFSYTAGSGTNIGLNRLRFFHTGINFLPVPAVDNTLTSTSTTIALSAAQGKVLQDAKAPLTSPTFTGVPAVPTAVAGTNTTQAASTAFVAAAQTAGLADTAPLINGTAAIGVSVRTARQDHVHPTDTTRQATLVSGTNIRTVNGNSLLGSTDLVIAAAGITSTAVAAHPQTFTALTTTTAAGTYTASASSSFNATYPSWQAFDGSAVTEWATLGETTNFWIGMQFPTARVVTGVFGQGRATEHITNWTLQGSMDGVTWTPIQDSNVALVAAGATVAITNTTAYTRYRVLATGSVGSNPGLVILRFEMRNYVLDNPAV